MTTAETANEYSHNIGHDFSMLDALDEAYLDTEGADDDAEVSPALRRYFANSGEVETLAGHARWCEGCGDCW